MSMAPKVLFLALISLIALQQTIVHATFATDVQCAWGENNCQINGDNLTLILNPWSGAAVQGTKSFIYGYIDMRIKLVPDNSAAVVTTYYTSSPGVGTANDKHDEIDFEFLGNETGKPYTIHTNIFVDGVGNREQQFRPWFEPTTDYHNYRIFWNPYMVVWSIDGTIFRVYKNHKDKGIPFPTSRPQTVYSSIWNADDWACQGGRVKTNWTHQPFIARYLNFEDSVCVWNSESSIKDCAAPSKWYAARRYKELRQSQIHKMNKIRSNNMIYNYCTDTKRFNGNMPPECSLPPY